MAPPVDDDGDNGDNGGNGGNGNGRQVRDAYLLRVGERVRSHRLRRGMTRGMLSKHSGVSERYLAQLEQGAGNISIQRLRSVAHAMAVPLSELVRDGPDLPVELSLIMAQLENLDTETLQEVRQQLTQRFRLERDTARRVALIGLRGAGKTTLGQRLAEVLDMPFVRLLREVEEEAGMDVSAILELSGQQHYRRLVRRSLQRVIDRFPMAVIEVGGSLASEPESFNLLHNACFTVWLRASPDDHMSRVVAQGDSRPMTTHGAGHEEAMQDLRRILAAREPFYSKADAVLYTSGRPVEDCVAELTRVCAPRLAAGTARQAG